MKRLALLLALLLAVGSTTGAAQESGFMTGAEPVLRPGDRVQVQVWRNPELSGTFLVSEDGSLQHPLYSQVQVAGVPEATARERVRTFLARFEGTPSFVFIPEFRVYVGGAVRDQNQHFFPEMSVGQAIVRAGGSTTPTSRHRVRLIRDGRDWRVNLNAPEAAALLQQPIMSGDQILVEESPTFARRYLNPTLQVIQTVTSLVSTYVFFDAIFNNE
jgi:protein involved in polysaccharide export with SLBB domain